MFIVCLLRLLAFLEEPWVEPFIFVDGPRYGKIVDDENRSQNLVFLRISLSQMLDKKGSWKCGVRG
jgi:hypothetical protein